MPHSHDDSDHDHHDDEDGHDHEVTTDTSIITVAWDTATHQPISAVHLPSARL